MFYSQRMKQKRQKKFVLKKCLFFKYLNWDFETQSVWLFYYCKTNTLRRINTAWCFSVVQLELKKLDMKHAPNAWLAFPTRAFNSGGLIPSFALIYICFAIVSYSGVSMVRFSCIFFKSHDWPWKRSENLCCTLGYTNYTTKTIHRKFCITLQIINAN